MDEDETSPRLQWITTTTQLADHLDVPEKKLRAWLRQEYPQLAPGRGGTWELTPRMNHAMAARAGR